MAIENVASLLERERELHELDNALTEARQERGQLVLVRGPAGIGKTSLLKATLQRAAEAGFLCLRARAGEFERDFAYGCVRQLLEPAIARASAKARERLFEGAAALATPLFAHIGISQSAPTAESNFSVLHGLYWLLNNLARESPVALCIDDLHWSDTESQRFLNYLAARLDGVALVVLVSARTGEKLTPDLARLFAAPEAKVLRLDPLSIEATGALCERRLGAIVAHDFAAACHASTGGNPFFLETLLREAKELNFLADAREAARVRRIGPAAVARAVLLRLSTAPAAATAFVRAVAVLGDGTSVVEAARLAGLAEDEAARAADLLVTLAILKQAEGIEFAHPIVRQAVYADIGAFERARAHARAAQILAEGAASDERIATQIAKAEPIGEAGRVELLRRAAAGAVMRGAPAAAVVWLRRALTEPPPPELRPEVLLELGSAELRLAMPEAVDHLEAAVESIRKPELLAFAARQLANAHNVASNDDRAVSAIESAIEVVERQNSELALILEAELAAKAQLAHRDTRTRVEARLARYRDLKGATPGERLVLASVAFERARASESEREAVQYIERALTAGGLLDERQPDVVGTFYMLVIGLLGTDALDLGLKSLEEALADARARASVPAMAYLISHHGWFCLRSGDVGQADADARTALELMTAHDIRLGPRFALALLVEVLIESGQLDAAENALRDSGLGTEIPPGLAHYTLLEARGLLRLAQGNARAALEDLIEFGRREELWPAANRLASRWRSHACLALAAAGENELARDMAAEGLERARRWGAVSGIGMALRATALVEGGAKSIDRLREGVEFLGRSPAKLECARALTDLGAALRRANRRAEARRVLEDALNRAGHCGSGALVERARTELRAAGGRSSDPTSTGVQRLTVSERRVAELAAKGHSNPEIAQALFVTRKTVETHLGRIYSKLDISGRAELGSALAGQSPTAGR